MEIIEKEVAAGIPLSRIVLGGFSQGAALSLFSGYQTKTVLGGIIAMSGYLPRYAMSKEKLETAGVKNIEFHSYPDMEHGACMEELDDVTKWLQRVIPDTQK
ncbi:hypothetical protein AM588_10002053 [Phytophthora nicotianae]|uniref:Phospholipase/carboxylesterase/thioesterase domain-containing protein n=1 Tax=Phytophthora nicotianae TaxID=4792 RepID=A0A0W8CR16_PHYNI|nr:hypothetical protein AM588_10002053 [Phytophthora nicotianae]